VYTQGGRDKLAFAQTEHPYQTYVYTGFYRCVLVYTSRQIMTGW